MGSPLYDTVTRTTAESTAAPAGNLEDRTRTNRDAIPLASVVSIFDTVRASFTRNTLAVESLVGVAGRSNSYFTSQLGTSVAVVPSICRTVTVNAADELTEAATRPVSGNVVRSVSMVDEPVCATESGRIVICTVRIACKLAPTRAAILAVVADPDSALSDTM